MIHTWAPESGRQGTTSERKANVWSSGLRQARPKAQPNAFHATGRARNQGRNEWSALWERDSGLCRVSNAVMVTCCAGHPPSFGVGSNGSVFAACLRFGCLSGSLSLGLSRGRRTSCALTVHTGKLHAPRGRGKGPPLGAPA